MLPAWCRKPNSFFSQLFLDVKSGQGRLWLCCVLYVFKSWNKTPRVPTCRPAAAVPGGWSPPPSSTTEEGVSVCADLRQQRHTHTACEGTWPSRHARVGCGLPDRPFVRFRFLHAAPWQSTAAAGKCVGAGAVGPGGETRAVVVSSPEDPRGRTWAGRSVNHTWSPLRARLINILLLLVLSFSLLIHTVVATYLGLVCVLLDCMHVR
jgi:hypothetical protein